MGNTTSSRGDPVKALTSIRDDAMKRWEDISGELMVVEHMLFFREAFPDQTVTDMLKLRAKLTRHSKLLKSNIKMANKGLLLLSKNDCDKLCSESEKYTDECSKSFYPEMSEEEAADLIEKLQIN
jgi:hypothetical protein